MKDLNNLTELGVYDTAINVIGGLKDFDVIFRAIDSHFSQSDSLKELIHQRNELNIRTEKAGQGLREKLEKDFYSLKMMITKILFVGFCNMNIPHQDKELILLWQFALNNRLFREITTNVFVKIYYSGRTVISKNDITAYLKEVFIAK